jgi:hypothetical protein
MSEFWVEKCENPKCGSERRIQSCVPTLDPDAESWIYIRVGPNGGVIHSFCPSCAAPIRAELAKVMPALDLPMPESDADRGPIQ